MKVINNNHIDVNLDKVPVMVEDRNGKRRGPDVVQLSIAEVESYDTDLIQNGNLILGFTNTQALEFAKQLIECTMRNVDDEFKKTFLGVPPF